MSGAGKIEGKTQNKVAPPPPPPPDVERALQSTPQAFVPSSGVAFVHLSLFIGGIFALGALLVFFGGALSSLATPLIPTSFDRSLGEASEKQFSLTNQDCDSSEALVYVQSLARPLLEVAEPLPFEFSFRVANNEEINAFALPGGYVTVNWGLLRAASSGEEVAGVIGHEIQHALLRHGTRRILRQVGGSVLLSLVFGGTDFHSYGQLAAQLSNLSYDRAQESEADRRGVELMLKGGYDPSGLASFFERLGQEGPTPPAFLSTHPDPGDRARLVGEAISGQSFKKLPSPRGLRCMLDAP